MTMILHCGGEQFDRQIVNSIPTPPSDGSYRALPYAELVGMVEDVVASTTGFPLRSEQYGLNRVERDGNGRVVAAGQIFFALTYDDGQNEGNGFTIAGRSSHDKSLSVACVGGTRVFVCDNLALSGDSFRVQRKHTTNMVADLHSMLVEGVEAAVQAHKQINARWDTMRAIDLDLDQGYMFHGIALGHGTLKPQQITRAQQSWANEFSDKPDPAFPQHGRSLYGWYQSLTEGLKRGAANTMIQRHVEVDRLALQAMDLLS